MWRKWGGGAKVEEGGKGEGERAQGLSSGFSAKKSMVHIYSRILRTKPFPCIAIKSLHDYYSRDRGRSNSCMLTSELDLILIAP